MEISLRVPAQEGLKHSVWLAFQNDDELHFAVGHFWFEWFPCTDQGKVRSFVDAVTGFLSGSYRSLEHYRGTDCFKAKLQRRTGNDWETIATWSKIRWPSFRRVTYKEITNVQQMSQIEPDL